jgi:hypothetical protein
MTGVGACMLVVTASSVVARARCDAPDAAAPALPAATSSSSSSPPPVSKLSALNLPYPSTAPATGYACSKSATKTSVLECVGSTPLVELRSLSRLTGCRILGKLESLNPAGSVKDRAAGE